MTKRKEQSKKKEESTETITHDQQKHVDIVKLDSTAMQLLLDMDAEIEMYCRGGLDALFDNKLICWMELKIPMTQKTYNRMLKKLHIQYNVPRIT